MSFFIQLSFFQIFIAPSKCVNLLTHGNNCLLNKERHCYICCFIYSSELVSLGSFISEYLNLFFNSYNLNLSFCHFQSKKKEHFVN